MRRSVLGAVVGAAFVLSGPGLLFAQLQTSDVILHTNTAITHIRGGTATNVVPVATDGNPVPANWGNGAIVWIPGTQLVVVASGVSPFGIFLLDFNANVAAPSSKRLGLAAAAVRDLDVVPATGELLILESTTTGGQMRSISGPVNAASTLNAAPWATNLPIGNTDYFTIVNATTILVGGVANIYVVTQGSSTGGTAAAFNTGNTFYSTKAMETNATSGNLFVAVFNPDYVRQLVNYGGTTYGDLGNLVQTPDIDGPEDVEVDPSGLVYIVSRNGAMVSSAAWGLQTGNDNAIISVNPAGTYPSNITGIGPATGHGNSGFFANLAVVGALSAFPASVSFYGVGCVGASAQPFTLGTVGNPVINQTFMVTLANAQPGALAFLYLAIGQASSPVPIGSGCFIYVDPTTLLQFINLGISPIGPIPLGGTGSAAIPIVLPNDPNLAGTAIDVQAGATDTVFSFVTSNGMRLQFGF